MSAHPLPFSIAQNPTLDRWVDFSNPDVVRVFTAKVEIGQGITTAMAQIAAQELRLPLARIELVSGDTRYCPNESYTAGSMSIEIGGTSMRIACAEALKILIERAAATLDVEPARLSAAGGSILLDGAQSGLDYWKVARGIDWKRPITGEVEFAPSGEPAVIGTSARRVDLPGKIDGAGFIHDLEMPNMLHARVMRPPSYGARLSQLDASRVERLPGVVAVLRSGDFVGVCAEREYQAVKALEALRAGARWDESELSVPNRDWRSWLPTLRSIDSDTEAGQPSGGAGLRRLSAVYSRPPVAHASMAPSCAITQFDGGRLTVWSHTQGVFPLRAALARTFKLDAGAVTVIHVPGAGVYGHNGADDVALDAALLAREVAPRPVRMQWMRDDEMAWSPLGSPMVVKLGGALDADGRIADWNTEIWSGPHGQRPSSFGNVNLLAAAHIDPPIADPEAYESLRGFAGGARNSEPPYKISHRKTVLHSLPGLPFRTSALRTLGGYANVFAVESFMDELAALAGADPIEFRLRHLDDPRARRAVETAARMSGWSADEPRGSGCACGFAFARYKTTAAYVAVVAKVDAREEIRVVRVDCAVDAGLVINPDGVRNQIEGGIIQSVSWTLKEAVEFDGRRVATRSWSDYPILRFREVPEVFVELLDSRGEPPLGVGEAAQGPAAAAIANAIARALDIRVRDLPLTQERLIAASIRQ